MKNSFKRLCALTLASIVLCGVFFTSDYFVSGRKKAAFAETTWSGARAGSFADGDGFVTNPFLISSAAQLGLMAYNINNSIANDISCEIGKKIPFNEAFYKLTCDINLSCNAFESIGKGSVTAIFDHDNVAFSLDDSSTVFKGHFNGAGFTISGLKGGALFGATDSAYIRNFNLTDVNVGADDLDHDGAVVSVGIDTEVRNVKVTGSVSSSGGAAGGIMGYGVRSSVFACENEAAVSGAVYAGGLAGALVKGGLGDCINKGPVSSSGGAAGGIMGYGMQASINRTINSAGVTGTPSGEFIGSFNTVNSDPTASVLALLGTGVETSTCIPEAGALIKDSFYNTDTSSFTAETPIGSKTGAAESYISVKGLDTVHMTGRMQQKLNMSDLRKDAEIDPSNPVPDLLFHKWWKYNDTGLPEPIRWEMWVDSIEAAANDPVTGWIEKTKYVPGTDSPVRKWPEFTTSEVLTAEKIAYLAYMVNRGLFLENEQENLQLVTQIIGNTHYYGNIDLQGKLWIPFGTLKNPYMGATFNGIELVGTNRTIEQSFITNMTINSALSYQSFFGVVKQRSSSSLENPVNSPESTLKVKGIHLAGMEAWSGSIDMAAGFVSLYRINKTAPIGNNDTAYYYQFYICITSGDLRTYGHATGLTAGFTGLLNKTNSNPNNFKFLILGSSGNAANIISYAANTCGLVFNLSNIDNYDNFNFGVRDCFNTGIISSFKPGGIASGLISYVNAAINTLYIFYCYNAGDLYAPNGLVANYAGNIIGSSDCYFGDDSTYCCYYREEYPAAWRKNNIYAIAQKEAAYIGIGLSLSQMRSGNFAGQIGSCFMKYDDYCNNGFPYPNKMEPFYEVTVKYNKHDGDVVIGSNVVERPMPISGVNFSFICQTSILNAYPISSRPNNSNGANDDIIGWIPAPTDGISVKTARYEIMKTGITDVEVTFKSMLSVTVISSDSNMGSVSVEERNSQNDTLIGASNYNTYIYAASTPNKILAKAMPEPGFSFMGWYNNQALEGNSISADNPYETAKEGHLILYAKFKEGGGDPVTYYSVVPAVASACAGMGTVSGGESSIPAGTTKNFTFTATAAAGHKFAGWYGNDNLSGAALSTSAVWTFPLEVTGNVTYYAKFIVLYTVYLHAVPETAAALEFVTSGTGFTVPEDIKTENNIVSGKIGDGEKVRVSVLNSIANYQFDGWYNSENQRLSGGTSWTTDAITGVTHFYARFLPQYKLRATIKVTIGSAAGGSTAGAGEYEEGDTAVIQAFADKGFKFAGWYDGSGSLVSDKAEYSFVAAQNQTFTPVFEKDRRAVMAVLYAFGGAFTLLSCGLFCWLLRTSKFYRRPKTREN